MRGAVRRAARIVTCSEHVRGEVVELLGVDPGRVVVTPLGVHERFRPAPPDEHALARLGVRRPYLLAVATVSPRKNLAAVVRAYSRIAADHPGLGLVIAGATGWRTEETDRAIRAAPSGVVTTGFVADEDLVALYNGAACLVFPSLEEGFGLPPLEAMACGTPVVASNTTSIPEVVGDAGLLVHPGDEEAIELAVRRVLEDGGLAEELRKRGLERARGFSWEACARLTVDVYRAARDH
jgi:glycosyltransferase involved in cell wall biosynthesis